MADLHGTPRALPNNSTQDAPQRKLAGPAERHVSAYIESVKVQSGGHHETHADEHGRILVCGWVGDGRLGGPRRRGGDGELRPAGTLWRIPLLADRPRTHSQADGRIFCPP